MSHVDLPRRRFLQTSTALAAGSLAGAMPSIAVAQTTTQRSRSARVAHLTDIHLQPELDGEAGFVACLHHVQTVAKPDLILFGGDVVFDVTERDAARRDQLGDLWRRVLKSDLSTPHRSAIGNHDLPALKEMIAANLDADAAKRWSCDLLSLDKRYYSFDQFGWHVIVLDSVHVGGPHAYSGQLDAAQRDWLERDLAATRLPTLVLSHIPIVSITAFFDGDRTKTGDWDVPASFVHIDANALHERFVASGKVKLCLSGHMHQLDRCAFDGITYACHGAVCGNWWKGTYKHTPAGYAVVDLFADGAFEIAYEDYGWQAKA